MTDKKPAKAQANAALDGVSINWDDSDMRSVYANIGTATANREEFFLLLGTHQNWRGTAGDTKKLDVKLSERVVMSPFAAKRLSIVLAQSIVAYESQFGEIKL